MTPVKNIVWIASYPKSGNTWVRFLCCNLLFGRQETASDMNVFAPDMHEMQQVLTQGSHAGLVKTHFAYSFALPLVERTAAAIYVVRNPADVLFSNFYYAERSARGVGNGEFCRYFDEFIENRGDPRWVQLGMGSWIDNVLSWNNPRHAFPVLVVKYEDLSTNARGVCGLLAQLLRPQSTVEEIQAAVDNSSFERMREIESIDIRDKRVGIFYKPYLQEVIDSGSRFMRKGTVGEAIQLLNQEQRTRLNSVFGPLVSSLGYSKY